MENPAVLQTMQPGNTSNDSLLGVLLMQAKSIELHKDMAERPIGDDPPFWMSSLNFPLQTVAVLIMDFLPAMEEKILCMMLFGRQKKSKLCSIFG